MDKHRLDEYEQLAANNPENQLNHPLFQCISRIRSLQHQLADPNYLYSDGRIHREAILVRNASIESLRLKLKETQEKYNLVMTAVEKQSQTVQDDISDAVAKLIKEKK